MNISKQRRLVRSAILNNLGIDKLAWLLGVSVIRAEKLMEQEKVQMERDQLKQS